MSNRTFKFLNLEWTKDELLRDYANMRFVPDGYRIVDDCDLATEYPIFLGLIHIDYCGLPWLFLGRNECDDSYGVVARREIDPTKWKVATVQINSGWKQANPDWPRFGEIIGNADIYLSSIDPKFEAIAERKYAGDYSLPGYFDAKDKSWVLVPNYDGGNNE